MKIDNVRLGFACNSSSTHSLIFLPGAQDDKNEANEFGWQFFTAASREAKMRYLAIVLRDNLQLHVDDENARHIIKAITGEADGYIDHQSLWILPVARRRAGVDLEFFAALKDYILQEGLAILGGNDNGGAVHPVGHGFSLKLPQDYTVPLVCRRDGAYWILFNRETGAKIRMSFEEDPEPYTKSAYPELVDIKITDYCAEGCEWCYQDSRPEGHHANPSFLRNLLSEFADMGVFEVALGGGDTMAYPGFVGMLRFARRLGMVPNFTTRNIDWLSVPRKVMEIIPQIGRFAYSVNNKTDIAEFAAAIKMAGVPLEKVSVQHVVGTTKHSMDLYWLLVEAARCNVDVTLLGYKSVGRGKDYEPADVRWIDQVQRARKDAHKLSVSIDTDLADKWHDELIEAGVPDILYTREEGKFSMYMDAVSQKVGPSSYEPDKLVSLSDFPGMLGDKILSAYALW